MTDLATDYLNHFNEAIMMLESATGAPDVINGFLTWRPPSYEQHFAAALFADRDAAIAAHADADPSRGGDSILSPMP